MRTIMWSKWASNVLLLLGMGVIALMFYWQNRLLTLEEQQKSIGAKLGISPKNNNNGENVGRDAGGADTGTFGGAINAYDSIDGNTNEESSDKTVIIYNRIPKTGSTSLMGIAYELCEINNYHVIHLNTSKNAHTLNIVDQIRFAENVSNSNWSRLRRPAIYHGHLGYLDFGTLGVSLRPLYINVVRDPLERLISYYYFLRFGDNFRPEVVRKRKGNKETFDECVARSGPDCDPLNLWMQIPFFCGHHASCWEPGNAFALQLAKSNLAKSYFLVGTTENLEDFVALLEASLPRFFRGALQLFNSEGKSHLRKTFGKQMPSKETVKAIHKSKIWQMEQDFYMFAKKNFNSIRKRALPTDGSTLPQQFRFEKIRPKLSGT